MKECILVVDDEARDRELTAHILESGGHCVLTAGNFEQAVAEARGRPIDMLITDIALPGRDGIELAEHLRAQARGDLAVLYISGSTGSNVLPYRGISTGGSQFLQKPFSRAELLQRVRKLLAPQMELAS